jgi:hypothetical protein
MFMIPAGGVGINPQFVAASGKRLTRTFASSPVERRKFGLSFWVKRVTAGTTQHIISGRASSLNFYVRFTAANQIECVDNNSGNVTTGSVFGGGETGVWRHVVISYDTTAASGSDRVSFWIDGTLNSEGIVVGNFAPSSLHHLCRADENNRIGSAWDDAAGSFLNAYLRDFHFIDGLTVTASQFATAGVPITYAGSYGTNGFKLSLGETPVALAALGADVSGNANNWTPVNF